MTKRRAVVLTFVVLLVAAAAGYWMFMHDRAAPQSPSFSKKVGQVAITEDGFSPATLKIKAGMTVMWTNVDIDPHRIQAHPYPSGSDLPALDSKTNLGTEETHRFTFTKPGTYGYHDYLNPSVNGTIIVE